LEPLEIDVTAELTREFTADFGFQGVGRDKLGQEISGSDQQAQDRCDADNNTENDFSALPQLTWLPAIGV
jgi:hypothetical protein